ncbi:hypothetical protein BKA69DRAFT_1039004 [Paraphysoderma sedebokerense]|nr:hypothetical protein BKA69DRAFT_1039004 [Paraphysoderma sedebokerense]
MSTNTSRKQTLSMQGMDMSRSPYDKKKRSDTEGRQSNRNTRPSKTNRQPHHSSMSNDAQSIKGFGLCKYEKVTSKTSPSRERREASRDQETGGLMWFEDRIGERPSRRDIEDVKIKVEPSNDTTVKQLERNNHSKRKLVKKGSEHGTTKDSKALNNSRSIPETTQCKVEDDIRVKQEDTESELATQSLKGEFRLDSQSESVQVKREIEEAQSHLELSEGEILEDDNIQIVQPPTNDISEGSCLSLHVFHSFYRYTCLHSHHSQANPNVVGPRHQAAVELFRTTARDESIQRREKSVSPLVHAYQNDGAEIAEFAMDCGYAADNCSESDDTTGSVDYGTLPYFFGHECEIPETFQCYMRFS